MDAATFSTALFANLCRDLGFDGIPVSDRFNPASHFDPSNWERKYALSRSLLCSAFKKSEVESDPVAEMSTLLKFLTANHACQTWKLDESYGPAVAYSIGYARQHLRIWFEPRCGQDLEVTQASIEMRARFGPGQSVGLNGKPSQYYFKVGDASLTATSDFIRSWYDQSVQYNALCEAAEMARKARCGPAFIRQSGTLSFVPKSYTARRTVITEPSLNTYFQLGLGEVIEKVLFEHTGISLSTQSSVNQTLACEGSVKGSLATMDLKECSDYISLAMLGLMLPKSLLDWVKVLRTPLVKIDGLGEHPLWMASTMGNGFTFPLQTALLTAVAYGVYNTLDIPVNPGRNLGIFGDDIVITTEAYNLMRDTLTALGLKVNEEKSFCSGPFRESCGADYVSGYNVRGLYFKQYTRLQDYYSIFNRLAIWGAKHALSFPASLTFLKETIGSENWFLVPPDEGVCAGIISPVPPGPEDQRGGWTYHAYKPKPKALDLEPWSAEEILQNERGYRRWLSALLQFTEGSVNEPAVLKALLYGAIRRGKAIVRIDKSMPYTKSQWWTPRWGYSTDPNMSMDVFARDRWMRSVISQVINGS